MKCVILAAGYATRLYPLTENYPKPLLKVGEKTILDWLIGDLRGSGKIDRFYGIVERGGIQDDLHAPGGSGIHDLRQCIDFILQDQIISGVKTGECLFDLLIRQDDIQDEIHRRTTR